MQYPSCGCHTPASRDGANALAQHNTLSRSDRILHFQRPQGGAVEISFSAALPIPWSSTGETYE